MNLDIFANKQLKGVFNFHLVSSMTITLKKKNGKLLKNLYCQNHKLGTEKVRVGNPL